jgi:hypothetical protein
LRRERTISSRSRVADKGLLCRDGWDWCRLSPACIVLRRFGRRFGLWQHDHVVVVTITFRRHCLHFILIFRNFDAALMACSRYDPSGSNAASPASSICAVQQKVKVVTDRPFSSGVVPRCCCSRCADDDIGDIDDADADCTN